MQYDVSFGRMTAPRAGGARADGARGNGARAGGKRFRLAVLGDFSGRAGAGTLEFGEALARRKPVPVDVDNLEAVLARMLPRLTLRMDEDGGTVSVPIGEMDDFHPDQLVENVELFGALLQLRRDLNSKTGFARASREVLSWSGEAPLPAPREAGRGVAVAPDLRLSDFARLTGRAGAGRGAAAADAPVEDLVRRLVGPFVQPSRDAGAEQLVARVDAALSAAMRRVLHHPDFQDAEAAWRGVELLVRRLDTGARLQVVLFDVSAEEFAADLASGEALERSGLYGMLVEQPALDADQGPFSAAIGLYGFELSPPHADLLGRMAQVAAAGGLPFVAGIAPDALQTPLHEQNPLIRQSWEALRALPAAAYLGLGTPRFLLRMPYGRRSDPVDAFAFEEFTREAGLSGMLWGHPALAIGLLLAQNGERKGVAAAPGGGGTINDVPYYVYAAPDGEQVALPCTERLYGERQAAAAAGYGAIPVVSLRGRPEIRVAGFGSVAGVPLAGPWGGAPAAAVSVPEPEAGPDAVPEPDAVPAEAGEPVAAEADGEDLDALLASLEEPPAAEAPAVEDAAGGEDDLDALLASLGAPAEPAAEGETEADLDALLASL